MNCAMIKISTNEVTNVIVCESNDPAPEGFMIIGPIPTWVVIGNTSWNGTDFGEDPNVPPPPKVIDGLETL